MQMWKHSKIFNIVDIYISFLCFWITNQIGAETVLIIVIKLNM